MVSANCALLFLWNIFKCEGSRPLFVEKTKYKLISRCPPELVSLPANTRLVSVAGDRRLDLDALGLKKVWTTLFFQPISYIVLYVGGVWWVGQKGFEI